MACDIQELLDEANCLSCEIPPGMLIYAQLAAMCNISDPVEFTTGLLQVGEDGVDEFTLTVDSTSNPPFILTRYAADNAPVILRMHKKGTTAGLNNPAANQDVLTRLDFRGWDGTDFFPGSTIQTLATQAWTGIAHGSQLSFQVVATGAIANNEVFRLTATQVDARSTVFAVSGTQVVGARNTGWTTFTGTANKNAGALDTGTATTAQVAQVVKSIMDALISHGLLGA